MASQQQEQDNEQLTKGPGCIPPGAKTSDYYRTKEIPNRFENPSWFQGYGGKTQHPMYKTTSNVYGSQQPSVHTMPTSFHCRAQGFSGHLGKCGMYRNYSLNTDCDRSPV